MSKIEIIENEYLSIQKYICDKIEKIDGSAKFIDDKWESNLGTGLTKVVSDGEKIEKGAVNFSLVKGRFSPQMSQILGESGKEFAATGISSIFHPINPWCPIIHMNVRYFELDTGVSWFGGGIDLTPHYVNKKDASIFHKSIKKICDKYASNFYYDYKKWCDDYFYLKHREETRGIGGIFFDRVKPEENKLSFDKLFDFTKELANSYPEIYEEQIILNNDKKFDDNNIKWQNIRRSRYVEYNLLFDRGTKFGLESGGRTESILVSMPPTANWYYDYKPIENSEEETTLNLLKKNIDWININE